MEDAELTAFAQLYDQHAKAVYNYACLLIRSIPDAEDVTQECFLALVRKPEAFDPARSQLRTWLLAVAHNQVNQRRRRAPASLLSDDERDAQPLPEDLLLSLERTETVRRALESLPSLQREALYLFEIEGLTLAETAQVLAIEPNAVKARLFRGRENMKRLLEPLRPALSWKGAAK